MVGYIYKDKRSKKSMKSSEVLTFDLTILNLLKEGKNPSTISKELNVSKQKISYYTRKFEKLGLIIKKGYGVWEVKQVQTSVVRTLPKEIRGHAFIWVIKVPKEMQGLKERASKIGTTMNKGQVRLIIKNHKVWIGKENIIIYENKSFYAKDSPEARKYAVLSMMEVLRALQSELGVTFKRYIFKPSREHYGMIKNDLARQYNEKKEKLVIHDDLEGDWLWIDDSESLNELETGGLKAVVRSKQVQDWWNDNKKHNFEVTPSFVLNALSQTTVQVNEFSKQIKSHLKLINEYRKENISWRKNESIKIAKQFNSQKRLSEYG